MHPLVAEAIYPRMSRPIGTADELERRREWAVRAVVDGESRATVAEVLGVHVKTVSRRVRAARQPGGLAAEHHPGPTPGLTAADLERLAALRPRGAKAQGGHNELRTATRVARLIEREFDIGYHPEHVRAVPKRRLGWTSQKPRRTAQGRNDEEVARWVGGEFPWVVREASRRTAHVAFLDESGFFQTPTVRRTLAPRGQTPVLAAWDRRDRLSAISAITLSPVAARPNLYFEVFDHTVHAEQVVAFLADLHRRLGPLTVVWDRGAIHDQSGLVRAWLADHPGVVTEKFPGDAPDLNPDEGVWGWTKYGRLSNLAADDTDESWDHVIDELITVKFSPRLLKGFIRETRLPGISMAA